MLCSQLRYVALRRAWHLNASLGAWVNIFNSMELQERGYRASDSEAAASDSDAAGGEEDVKIRQQAFDDDPIDALVAQDVTTLMIRNLPQWIKQGALLAELDRSGFLGTYDFCYMPCSFENGEGKGYAFVNFTDTANATELTRAWHRTRRFGMRPNDLALSLSPAVVQGLENNVAKWSTPRLSRVRNPDLRPFILSDIKRPKSWAENQTAKTRPRRQPASRKADVEPSLENPGLWPPVWPLGLLGDQQLLPEHFSMAAHALGAAAMLPPTMPVGAVGNSPAWPAPWLGKAGGTAGYNLAVAEQYHLQVAHMAHAVSAAKLHVADDRPADNYFDDNEETTVVVSDIGVDAKQLPNEAWKAWMEKNGYAGCFDSLRFFSPDECRSEFSSLIVNFIDPEDAQLFCAESPLLISQFSTQPPVAELASPADVEVGQHGVHWLRRADGP